MERMSFNLRLLGPARLFAPDGSDITPTGAKQQALLALLATTQGEPWARAALQDKLWSTFPQTHGRDSLKKALTALRRRFGPDHEDMIRTNGMMVCLDMTRIRCDLFECTSAPNQMRRPFLEGIDVKDDEFNDWLSMQRARWDVAPEPQTGGEDRGAPLPLPSRHETQKTAFTIAIMSTGQDPGSPSAGYADLVADRVVLALNMHGQFDVVDYRDAATEGTRAADVALRVRAITIGPDITVTLCVRRVSDNAVLWGDRRVLQVEDLNTLVLASLVTQLIDQLSDVLMRPDALGAAEQHIAAKKAMGAIDMMFRLSHPNLNQAARDLGQAIEIDPRGTYLAWYAYHTVFRMEATKGKDVDVLREHAGELIARVLEIEPNNALARSLLTHVYSFVFRDFDRAAEMIRPIGRTPPDTPFYHHALAALRFYKGDLAQAREAAENAVILGTNSPYNYAFSTMLSMIDTLDGKFDTAIRQGRQVLAMHRGATQYYEPTLRYLCAAYAHDGQVEKAAETVRLIRRQSPGFTVEGLRDRGYPVPSDQARDVLLGALATIPAELQAAS